MAWKSWKLFYLNKLGYRLQKSVLALQIRCYVVMQAANAFFYYYQSHAISPNANHVSLAYSTLKIVSINFNS
jgi:hypothetical protein